MKLKEVAGVTRSSDSKPASRPSIAGAGKRPAKAKAKAGGGAGVGAGKERTRAAVRVETNTFDIRGRRASEIEADLGRAIDRSLGLGTLFVIHGMGTGSLKAAVRQLLKEDPLVTRFEDAPQYEGGDGCTIAFLR